MKCAGACSTSYSCRDCAKACFPAARTKIPSYWTCTAPSWTPACACRTTAWPPNAAVCTSFARRPDEVRGRVFDIVFLPGLCEGLFPSRAHEDPILLDVYRAKLDAGLRVQDDRVAAERRRL